MKKNSLKKRGFATGAAMTSVIASIMILGALMYAASTQLSLVRRSLQRTSSTLVAEAGIEHAMSTLTANWNASGGSGMLYEDPGVNTTSAGSFSYTISALNESKRLITATGTSPTGRSAQVVGLAEFISGDAVSLSRYALLAKAYIGFGGSSSIQTMPLNTHNADARTNGYITQGGSSAIDGTLFAVGTIAGMGYYPNQPNYAEINFPEETQIQDWEAEWRTQSQSAGRTYSASSLPASIVAPAYITGDVSLTGKKTLTITGSGFVFVQGSLNMNAQTVITNSATLVVRDSFTCNGQSYYTIPSSALIPPSGGITGTLINLYGDMQLNGGGEATGIIYCARGNMRVNGGAIYRGSLIAGGYIETIGSYTQYYSGDMNSNVNFPINLRLTKIVEP